jgi:hypothetical protein
MDPLLVLLFAVGGYFVGSISAARLVTAIAAPGTAVPRETELRIEGSDKTVMMQSVSATSVSANLGAKYGFITYVIDVLIPWLWWRTHDPYVVLYAIAINVLLIASSFKEAKAWYRIKKEPGWNDPTEAWKISAMGRGIIKMGTKLGLIKKKEESGGGPRT